MAASAHADETAEKQKIEDDAAKANAKGTEPANEAKAGPIGNGEAGTKTNETASKTENDKTESEKANQKADQEATDAKGGPKANEAVRGKEGAITALPSVAGRPIRRYAEQGIFELGGNLSVVNANSFTQIGASPSVGWFFIDYVQLSFMPSVDYVKAAGTGAQGRYSALLEPSFHVQVAGPVFGFFGAGVGLAYERDTGAGLAVAPRSGINLLIGGSGVLTAAFSYVYTATKRTAIEDGSTSPHTSTIGYQMGYSVAW